MLLETKSSQYNNVCGSDRDFKISLDVPLQKLDWGQGLFYVNLGDRQHQAPGKLFFLQAIVVAVILITVMFFNFSAPHLSPIIQALPVFVIKLL